jgi:hypothetical protein
MFVAFYRSYTQKIQLATCCTSLCLLVLPPPALAACVLSFSARNHTNAAADGDRGGLLRTAFAVSLSYHVSITRLEYCTPLCLLLPAVEACFAHLAMGGYCVLFAAVLLLLRTRTTRQWSAPPLLAALRQRLHG